MPSLGDSPVAPSHASQRDLLLVVAADNEARAVLHGLTGQAGTPVPAMWTPTQISPGIQLMICGVGKSPAAAATAAALARTEAAGGFAAVLSLGIGGVLPGTESTSGGPHEHSSGNAPPHVPTPAGEQPWRGRPAVGDIVIGTASMLADEGVETGGPAEFASVAGMGFVPYTGHTGTTSADSALLQRLRTALSSLGPATGDHTPAVFVGPIATVSVCSGTDARAAAISARTGGLAECMEGAAVGLAASVFKVPFAEVRVISNRTGRREEQGWDFKLAMATLTRVAKAISQLAFSDR